MTERLTDEALSVLEKWQAAMDAEILGGLQKAEYSESVCTEHITIEVTYADVQTVLAHRRANPADDLRAILARVPSALNNAFGAGIEEREGGSARRQAKLMEPVDALRADIRAALSQNGGAA